MRQKGKRASTFIGARPQTAESPVGINLGSNGRFILSGESGVQKRG